MIGKVGAYIAQTGGSEQGVCDGVQEYIGIGVPKQAKWIVNPHTPNHERSSRDERMNVVALAHTQQGVPCLIQAQGQLMEIIRIG